MLTSINNIYDRSKMTPQDELHLFCYWQQFGNKWVEIAKLMGRSENSVKNNWKKVLRREGILTQENINEHIPALIEKLKFDAQNYSRDIQFEEAMLDQAFTESQNLNSNMEETKNPHREEMMSLSGYDMGDIKMEEEKPVDIIDDIPDEYGIIHDSSEGMDKLMETEERADLIRANFSYQ